MISLYLALAYIVYLMIGSAYLSRVMDDIVKMEFDNDRWVLMAPKRIFLTLILWPMVPVRLYCWRRECIAKRVAEVLSS